MCKLAKKTPVPNTVVCTVNGTDTDIVPLHELCLCGNVSASKKMLTCIGCMSYLQVLGQ